MGVLRRLVIFALLLAVAAGLGACGSGDDGETTLSPSATPRELAEAAGFGGVHSGELEVALEIDRYRKHPEEINIRVLGPFMKAGEGTLPVLDMAVESRGDLGGNNVDFLSGPLLRPEKVVVNFEGKVYEPDQATFEELKSKLEDALDEGGEGDAAACLKGAGDFNLAQVLRNVSSEGKSETLDGKPMRMVGADLDVSAATDELVRLSEDPACKAQLEAVGLPPAAQLKALTTLLEHSRTGPWVTLGVDKNGVVRYLEVLGKVGLQGKEELEVELVVRLSKVNEVTELADAGGSSPFPALLKQFGLTSEDIEKADGGEILVSVLGVLSDRLFGREPG